MLLKILLLIACIATLTAGTQLYYENQLQHEDDTLILQNDNPYIIIRQARSPKQRGGGSGRSGHGSLDIGYNADRQGRRATVQYNQNLYKTRDGRFTVNAYAHGSRNFDRHRNDYGGGIQGSFRF